MHIGPIYTQGILEGSSSQVKFLNFGRNVETKIRLGFQIILKHDVFQNSQTSTQAFNGKP